MERGRVVFFFSSRRRHTRCSRDWSSDVCSSDLLLVADLHSSLIAALVQYGLDAQPLFCFRGADHVYHGLEADQGLSFPVHADEGKHPMLDLVPLAGSRWIVANDNL